MAPAPAPAVSFVIPDGAALILDHGSRIPDKSTKRIRTHCASFVESPARPRLRGEQDFSLAARTGAIIEHVRSSPAPDLVRRGTRDPQGQWLPPWTCLGGDHVRRLARCWNDGRSCRPFLPP